MFIDSYYTCKVHNRVLEHIKSIFFMFFMIFKKKFHNVRTDDFDNMKIMIFNDICLFDLLYFCGVGPGG